MRYKSANEILKQVALEVGLQPVNSPVTSSEEAYVQLVALLSSAGRELVELNNWQMLTKPFEIVTEEGDSGEYDLPSDFSHMIDQTGWDRKNRVAIGGPLSSQDWTYLRGRDLVSQTIYVSFRLWEGKLRIFPAPPPPDVPITFEYASTDWVRSAAPAVGENEPATYSEIKTGSDIVMLHPLMVEKFVKMKWLQTKGFDSSNAALEFDTVFTAQIGKDTGAPILDADGCGRLYPYLNGFRNVGDTGFGGV